MADQILTTIIIIGFCTPGVILLYHTILCGMTLNKG